MNDCIIGIGSNINAVENIEKAVYLLGDAFDVIGVSDMIKTKPIGIEDQDDFTNGAIRVKTILEISQMEIFLKEIEDQLKRDRSAAKFGPRTIDLDIIVWNEKLVDKDYHTRDFIRNSCLQLGYEYKGK